MACPECAVGYHWECIIPNSVLSCCCDDDSEVFTAISKNRGGQLKEPDAITDLESTGRKRAALLYPFMEGMKCEWRNLFNAGGGVIPIVGCRSGLATARHHGPDKNTVNNSPNNVHRICADCHNRWHAVNDKFYDSIRPTTNLPYVPTVDFLPHDPDTKATEVEVVLSASWFNTKIKTEAYDKVRQEFNEERMSEVNG